MGLGVLEPHDQTKEVPGTVQLEGEDEVTLRVTANLKHGTGRHADVVLAPQPSDSPNDPLSELYSESTVLVSSIFTRPSSNARIYRLVA